MQKQGKLKNRKPILQTKAQNWTKVQNSNKKGKPIPLPLIKTNIINLIEPDGAGVNSLHTIEDAPDKMITTLLYHS